MTAKLRSRWEQIQKKYRRASSVVVIVLVVVVVIALIIAVVLSNGTGFNGYNKVSTVHTISGPSAGTVTRTEEYQPGKTLWDLLQLLIIPVVLALAGFWLNRIQKDRDKKAEEAQKQREENAVKEREKLERESREDNQHETALQTYFDRMSELLLHEKLRESKPEDEVRQIARIRTLAVLSHLDIMRKRRVIQFLQESRLIDDRNHYFSFGGAEIDHADLRWLHLEYAHLNGALGGEADFREAHLFRANLQGAHFGKADFSGAHLWLANLSNVDLKGANFSGADLKGADLKGANLTGADLTRADLSKPNFNEKDLVSNKLQEADLSMANLSGADLSDANLSGAKVTQEQWEKAKSLKGATMPDGRKHP